MKKLPLETGVLHFVGIGGIGMSGIAEVMHNLGYQVQGSDQKESANTKRLENQSIPVYIGHDKKNVQNAAVLIVSSAIPTNNPEIEFAKENRIPILKRADMLAEIMRLKWSISIAGTHGKTTTTSLVGTILDQAGLDPTIINGGIINAYGTNTRLGQGDWLVAEADESDGSFTKLPCTIGVITNIDPEHMDHYDDFDHMKQAYVEFIQKIPFYGFGVLCLDHPVIQSLLPNLETKKIITYGFDENADCCAFNLRREKTGVHFDLRINQEKEITDFFLPMHGRHNVQNALVALSIGLKLKLDANVLKSALKSFSGVKRRFTITGQSNGITFVDDYAHHPVEIKAVLSAAQNATPDGKVIAVMQPHRYTRLQSLFDDFASCLDQAGHIIISDVYEANEKPIVGVDRDHLIKSIEKNGHQNVHAMDDEDHLYDILKQITSDGDTVIFMGAGNITDWANAMPKKFEEGNKS